MKGRAAEYFNYAFLPLLQNKYFCGKKPLIYRMFKTFIEAMQVLDLQSLTCQQMCRLLLNIVEILRKPLNTV